MSALIKAGALFILLASCNAKEKSASSKGEAPYFSPNEVVSALNVLTAIIDWPKDTITHQKNFLITPESAQKLILPLHPLWDQKVEEVALEVAKWDKVKITYMATSCWKRCDCSFYQEILDRHPEIVKKLGVKEEDLAGFKAQRAKIDFSNCSQDMPPLQKLFQFLEKEQKDYQAESVN